MPRSAKRVEVFSPDLPLVSPLGVEVLGCKKKKKRKKINKTKQKKRSKQWKNENSSGVAGKAHRRDAVRCLLLLETF